MNKYSFIHHGARVHWNDPGAADYGEAAEDHLATVYIVHSINGNTRGTVTEDDDIVLIYSKDGSEAEVYPSELVEIKESVKERVGRYVRQADVFLISCLKYADARMKAAEKETAELREKLRRINAPKKVDKDLAKDEVVSQLQGIVKGQSVKIENLNKELKYFKAAYIALRQPEAKRLADISTDFDNTPEKLVRILMTCPETEPNAMDPNVHVVCEDKEGTIVPIIGAWYDNAMGAVRLSTDTSFSDEEDESNGINHDLAVETCYGRDDLLNVAEVIANEFGNSSVGEELCGVMADAAVKFLGDIYTEKKNKRSYELVGYFNEVEDLKMLAGKSADEIVEAVKKNMGNFFTSDDTVIEADPDNIKELEERCDYTPGSALVTSDGRFLVITNIPKKKDADDLVEGEDCDLFIDVYSLQETWITFDFINNRTRKRIPFAMKVEIENVEAIEKYLSLNEKIKDTHIRYHRPYDAGRVYLTADCDIVEGTEIAKRSKETQNFISTLKDECDKMKAYAEEN